jgi:magnesium-transporting ATPase (P-type)
VVELEVVSGQVSSPSAKPQRQSTASLANVQVAGHPVVSHTLSALQEFAAEGLRTLVFARRTLTPKALSDWQAVQADPGAQ